jgi:hypothetical protein
MTGKPIKLGKLTYHGFVPDTDPRYNSGWNFLSGKNLNPRSKTPSSTPEAEEENAAPKPPAQKPTKGR